MTGLVAVVQRDLRAVARSRSQLYSSVLLPLMLLALLGTGVSDGLEPAALEDGDYTEFLVPGMVVMTALFSSTFASASFYQDRANGMLKMMLVSPAPPAAVLGGKALAAVVIGTLQAVFVLVVAALVPSIDLNLQYGVIGSVVLAVLGIVIMNILLCGFALLLATRIRTMQGFHLVMNLVLFPLLFLSGAFFPLEDLPFWLRLLGYANPLTYAVDLLQLALYADGSDGYIGVVADLAVLAGLLAILALPAVRLRPASLALSGA
ncbi:MAG TPA: ABC transporter permease [Dehalococcoidia bacterium]|nr:ABC transporter permease [Dehalococcoidia bacterium]